jgi:hypothetical protein
MDRLVTETERLSDFGDRHKFGKLCHGQKPSEDNFLCQGQDLAHVLARCVIVGILCVMDTETVQTWIPTDADFGSRLALIRHRMSWNVKEAARECGVPAATWRLWEVEGTLPRNIVTVAMAIASKTGCDFLWLVHGPDRGSVRPTTRYAGEARVITRGGENRPRGGLITTRPVTQTRPIGRQSRPFTPVAV